MVIDEHLGELLNTQINKELYSAYLYPVSYTHLTLPTIPLV